MLRVTPTVPQICCAKAMTSGKGEMGKVLVGFLLVGMFMLVDFGCAAMRLWEVGAVGGLWRGGWEGEGRVGN